MNMRYGERRWSDFFPFEELFEMKINEFDLLENPKIYRVDPKTHRIESSV